MTDIARTSTQIGSLVQRHRKKLGLSQATLATKVGLRQATISKIEAGNSATRIDTILSILAVLDLELQIGARTKSSSADIEALF